MATLSFTFDTGNVALTRITNAVCVVYGYAENITDPNNPNATIPNPQTKADFARAVVRKMLIDCVRESDLRTAKANLEASVVNINLT